MALKRLFFAAALLLFSIQGFANPVILRGMYSENTAKECQTTIELSASTPFSSKSVHHPDRFVVDLKNVKSNRVLHFPVSSKSPVTAFRYARHSDGVTRLVFTLKKSIKARVVSYTDPARHSLWLNIIFTKKMIGEKNDSRLTLPSPKKTLASKSKKKPVLSDAEYNTTPDKYRNIIIVIDAGHGGKDPGAAGVNGTKEKNIVLSISKILQRDINKQPGFQAVLTRDADYYLTLRQRLAIARKDKADMFVAIHADKWRNTSAQGVSVFALSQRGATSEAARWLAHRENQSELMGGVQLQDQSHLLKSVLINLSQSATIRASLMIGKDIMHAVKPIARLHHNKVEQAAFVVLKSPDIPSLLVETGFLSNPKEESRLSSPAYQAELSTAMMAGIRQYFRYYPPRSTWLSYWKNNPNRMASSAHQHKSFS